MKKKTGLFAGFGIVIVIGLAIVLWYHLRSTSAAGFPINPQDHLSSWSFKGAYTGQPEFVQKANDDLAKQRAYLRNGKYDAYDVYVGIGNDYALLGNGRAAYQNYSHAIALMPKQGLAYTNLAALMAQLGAKYTAADAYQKGEQAEPGILTYHLEQLQFLTNYFATDTPRIVSALEDSSKQFGDVAQVLQIEANWLEGQHRYADAIKAWQQAILISPGRDVSGMQAAITRLKAKEVQQTASSTHS